MDTQSKKALIFTRDGDVYHVILLEGSNITGVEYQVVASTYSQDELAWSEMRCARCLHMRKHHRDECTASAECECEWFLRMSVAREG